MGMIPIDAAYLKAEELFNMVRNAEDDHEVVLAIAAALRTPITDVKPVQLRYAQPCCQCGHRLEAKTFQMCGLFKLEKGSSVNLQALVWCVDCWAAKWICAPKDAD